MKPFPDELRAAERLLERRLGAPALRAELAEERELRRQENERADRLEAIAKLDGRLITMRAEQ